MAEERKIVIKKVEVSNNCPECFNQELELTFYQKHTSNAFYHKTTNEVTHQLVCLKCGSTIYPSNWTTDIERVFDYYNKLVKPDRTSVRFTTLFFVLLILALLIMAGVVYYFLEVN